MTTLKINGRPVAVDTPPDTPLLWVLRDKLGITGPKYGCGVGVCRASRRLRNSAPRIVATQARAESAIVQDSREAERRKPTRS